MKDAREIALSAELMKFDGVQDNLDDDALEALIREAQRDAWKAGYKSGRFDQGRPRPSDPPTPNPHGDGGEK